MSYYGGYGGFSGSYGRGQNLPHVGYSGGYGGYGGDSYGGYGRQTNWCPSGEDYPPYCPQGGDDYEYTHCCKSFLWWGGSCCYLALSIWNIIVIIIGIIAALAREF